MNVIKKILKYLLWLLSGMILVAGIWSLFNRELVGYGFEQLSGQLHIVRNAKDIDEILKDTSTPDSLRRKLLYINLVKRFAIDSLGLKESRNYTTLYDQHNKPVLWVLTASEPYELTSFKWQFPILGEVSYKGFFEIEKGRRQDSLLRLRGLDTDLSEVTAWSTLGWFRDPILSGMLKRTDGQLAELIIHEMTHATVYIKSSVEFNENLASFTGEQGAIRFLRSQFGDDSEQLRDYLYRKSDYDLFAGSMLKGAQLLDSLYKAIGGFSKMQKDSLKHRTIETIVHALDTVSFHKPGRYTKLFEKELPNNTYFLSFIRYDAQKEEMKKEMERSYDNDIKKYILKFRDE